VGANPSANNHGCKWILLAWISSIAIRLRVGAGSPKKQSDSLQFSIKMKIGAFQSKALLISRPAKDLNPSGLA
jgi:hypothetical protein